jgi:hypothetical protein
MELQTYTIELKLRATEEGHAAMTEIIKHYAREVVSSAMLLSGDKAPQIMARTTDAFYSSSEITADEILTGGAE